MQVINNIVNRIRARRGKLSPAELALLNMPTENEIRVAQCQADHPQRHQMARHYVVTDDCFQRSLRFPDVLSVAYSDSCQLTGYLLWYVRTAEVWAARKLAHRQQAILDVDATDEQNLEAGLTRVEVIELLTGRRARAAKRIAANYRKNVPAFRARYPEPAVA